MADYLTTDTELTSVANAIRTKGGTSGSLVYPDGFVNAIGAISTGTDVSDTTAVEGDVLAGKYFHKANGNKVQGTIATKSGSDLTASGKTVTVPAGYYASQATKDVATGSAATPATTITASPSISVNSSGLITATNSETQSVTPTVSAGYVSSGTAGTVTVSGSNTSQLTTQAAQTIHPSTTDQTIASGKYLTGTQTVKGVLLTNLDAGNIKKDVVVKVGDSTDDDCVTSVTGTHEGGGGGNPVAEENDVIFIDYDGTIRYSYSASEFANLTELPANPVHDGLTAQGWNWTLSDAKTYVAANGNHVIGQMYTPDDGKTRLYISIPKGSSYKTITLYIAGSDLTIYWGDGTSNYYTDFIYSAQHTYSNTGDYVISISATYFGLGENGIFGQYNTDSYQPYRNMLQKVEISGTNIQIKNYCFYNCRCLKSITFPDDARFDTTTYLFYNCINLRSVTFPNKSSELSAAGCGYSFQNSGVQKVSYGKNITYKILSYSVFQGSPIERISIPPTQTKLYLYDFQNCYALREFTVPSNITEIGNNTFNNCIGIQAYHIKRTTPPTLNNVNVFTGIPADCKIYVPSASLSAYKSATNWSTYASYMVGE